MTKSKLKSPFSIFGGKSRVADIIWSGLGEISNYVEPFAGSLAVLLANPSIPKIETVNDKDCVAPDTMILRDDFVWVKAEDLLVGEKLIAFDENNIPSEIAGLRAAKKYRRFNHSTILSTKVLYKPCYKLTFSDGTVIISSENHLWLAGSHTTGSGGRGWRWIKTKSLVCNRKNQKSWILKVFNCKMPDCSYDEGWLAGILDGEGHITSGTGLKLIISQNEDKVLDKIKCILDKYKIPFKQINQRKCRQIVISQTAAVLECLAKFRPVRLIDNLIPKLSNHSLYGRKHSAVSLVSKEFLGEQKVIAIQTSSNTFIANGLASHNCFISNFWRAVSIDPEGVAKYADYPIHEADLHARRKWLLSEATTEFHNKMNSDPDYYDLKIAGWWVWCMGASIGSSWLASKENNSLPALSTAGGGIHGLTYPVLDWFKMLQERTKRTRVCCGDWTRVVKPAIICDNKGLGKKDITGVFLDPPYDHKGRDKVYREDNNVFIDVCKWAIANGDNPRLRIVLCGYEGAYDMPDTWKVHEWKANGGFGNLANDRGKANAKLERIWFSPYCLEIK